MNALWRISVYDDLLGMGAETFNGRWHTAAPDRRVVYLAEHPALALIEVLVNMRGNTRFLPEQYQLMRVLVSAGASTEVLAPTVLSTRWRENFVETQFIGNTWLEQGRSALLGVPSAPAPESTNYLLNPRHPDANKLIIEWARWIEYDKRLFRTHPHST